MATSTRSQGDTSSKPIQELVSATVRFCGDSGDGMQLAGTQLSNTSALLGNDIATFPDFPAEIRAPRGTLAGVSGFQIHFSSTEIYTPGDQVDALVAMNPAALKTNLGDLVHGGILIVDKDSFSRNDLQKAGYKTSPLEDGSLAHYQLFPVEITRLTRLAVDGLGLSQKQADRCRNFYAMGLIYWLYNRPLDATLKFIDEKFGGKPEIAEANRRTLRAGYNYGETTEAFRSHFRVNRAELPPGKYRSISGNQALAMGLVSASRRSGCKLVYAGYPITPASDILHELSRHKNFGVLTLQAEDEIAAITAAIGASYAGGMGVTASSGPGIALKAEAIGLAVMTELPVVIIDVQRGGPSTGLPTKTEQADLLQCMYGRNGESPVPILAASSPADCFDCAHEAWRVATRFMTPVFLLSDGYIANGSEPWRIPQVDDLPSIPVEHPGAPTNGETFKPYLRNERLARPWAIPGTPGLMHRIGGLEKADVTGNVSYDPANHQHMINTRAKKVANIADDIPEQTVFGPEEGDLLLVGWGGTFGAIRTAVRAAQQQNLRVAHAHLRWLNPFPRNLGQVLKRYKKVLVPELNMGQLQVMLRHKYLVDAQGLNKVQGRPFVVGEIVAKIRELVG